MRKSLKIENYVRKDGLDKNYKHYYFDINGQRLCDGYYNRIYEKDNYQISDQKLLWDFDYIFNIFKYHIRMNGSKRHIEKLIEILGKKVTKFYLEEWAKKNMIVALILKDYSDKMEDLI